MWRSLVVMVAMTGTMGHLRTFDANWVECEACHLLVGKANDWYYSKADWLPTLEELITIACAQGTDTYEVCKGAIVEMGAIVMGSLGKHYLDKDFICYKAGMCKSP
jgi:hypothetical protein